MFNLSFFCTVKCRCLQVCVLYGISNWFIRHASCHILKDHPGKFHDRGYSDILYVINSIDIMQSRTLSNHNHVLLPILGAMLRINNLHSFSKSVRYSMENQSAS